MSHLMHKEQNYQPNRKLPAKDQRVNNNREQSRETQPTKLKQWRKYRKFQEQCAKHSSNATKTCKPSAFSTTIHGVTLCSLALNSADIFCIAIYICWTSIRCHYLRFIFQLVRR